MRKQFEMSENQLEALLKASEPVPYLIVGGMPPSSPQERANAAWVDLGREMGFQHMTVEPLPEKGDTFFTAEATE